MQSHDPLQTSTGPFATKRCRKCGAVKTLAFFPRDRSRPDGRWHTCRACNRLYWHRWGTHLAGFNKRDKQAKRKSRSGLKGLRKYPHQRNREAFASLEPELRFVAQNLLNRYRARHPRRSQAQDALLIATATSNARRVGDRSWARRMWRLKGYRRAERRKAKEQAELIEIRARNAGKSRVAYLPLP